MRRHPASADRDLRRRVTSRRLIRELTAPSLPRQEPQDLLDEDDRWPLLQRCLTDDALPTDVPAASAITLLFGPSTERLRHLTPEHLKFDDKHGHNCGRSSRESAQGLGGSSRAWSRASRSRRTA
ncbi:hypothetical protein GCM10020000_80520 [Streptomyces olivoverticillatus]